jgi:hypothetical protein
MLLHALTVGAWQAAAALATFMNENIKTIKLMTLNLLTNFITFSLYLKELPLHITHIKLTLKSHSEKWLCTSKY